MTQSKDSPAIVKSVIALAHALRSDVVAEGIDTEDQATMLRSLQCDEVQGFLHSRPIPAQDVPLLIRQMGDQWQ